MKRKNKILFMIVIFISMLMISNKSNAQIQSVYKESYTDFYTQPLLNAFTLCYDLKDSTSTLGENKLDTHLMLNKDYAAVAFLAESTYGDNSYEDDTYTTSNKSGVYCMSVTEWTSSWNITRTGGLENYSDKYVEKINSPYTAEEVKGLGLKEGKSADNYPAFSPDDAMLRTGNWKYEIISRDYMSRAYYFRPVIWNIERQN